MSTVGDRYRNCSLDNFEVGSDAFSKQRSQALEKCRKFAARIGQAIDSGSNLVFCGPPGTGKDHLLVALLRLAIREAGASVQWCNGQQLFASFRDLIDSERTEAGFLRSFSSPRVLAISDPVPPKGDVSNHAAHMLYQIVDDRYRNRLSTWVTINVKSTAEAEQALGAPIFSRLLDSSFALFCNWPDRRRETSPEWLRDEKGGGH